MTDAISQTRSSDRDGIARHPDNFWNADRIDYVIRRWAAGFSAGIIALEIGASRNQVMGKVNRLKLPKRTAVPTRTYAIKRVHTAQVVRVKKPLIRGSNMPVRVKPPKVHVPKPPPEPKVDVADLRDKAWEALDGSSPVKLSDLAPNACLWPIGDGTMPYLFCAQPKHGQKSYCREHFALSHTAP